MFECRELVAFGERRFCRHRERRREVWDRVELDLGSVQLQPASWPQVDHELGPTTITLSSCC